MPRPRRDKLANATARRARVWELRKAGMPYSQIAEREGVSITCVHRDVQRVLAETARDTREEFEEFRRVQIELLERLRFTFYPAASRGDPVATDKLLRIIHRHHILLGGDPIASDPTIVVQNAVQELIIDITPKISPVIEAEVRPVPPLTTGE